MSNRAPNPSPAGHSVATTDPERFLGIRTDDGNRLGQSARPCAAPATSGTSAVQGSGTWRDLAVAGATYALRTWVAYWLLECFLWTLWPWLTTPSYEYQPTHPWFPVLSLGVYIIAGTTLGAALAICLGCIVRGSVQRGVPLVGPLSLAVTFGVLARRNHDYIELLIAFLLTAIIVTSFRRTAWLETLRHSVNFWSTPLGLLAYPLAVTRPSLNPLAAHFIGALSFMGVFLVAHVVARLRKRTTPPDGMRAAIRVRPLAVWVGLVAIFIALGFTLRQQPILTSPPRTAAPARNGLPNVILISLDTVRADHLSLYGYARDTTPNLRKFAQESTVFSNAISSSDMTLSSHASMFTGLYPSQHGAHWAVGKEALALHRESGMRLPENSRTLAAILSDRGYRTIGIVANTGYLQHAFQIDQGFQYYSQPNAVLFLERREFFYLRTNLSSLMGRFYPRSMSDLESTRAADINREALQLLRQKKRDQRPLFLFLNYMDAHEPYFPPAPYDSRYPGKDPTFTSDQYYSLQIDANHQIRPYTARDRRRDESQYDGGIAYIDASLRDLFAKLKELGLYDDSVIIVTSDHGQSFGEKQLVGHGSSVYQEQVRVPLIIKYPARHQALVRNDLVSHVDLLPTILDLLGDKIPPSLPGRSLRAPPAVPATVFSESFPCEWMSFDPRFQRVERAAFSGPFKLILSTNGKREFYDLAADPHEDNNLYSQNLTAASRLESDLRHWISILPKEHARPAVLDSSGVDRLKSLGYVQ